MIRPYIGITGFMRGVDVDHVCGGLPENPSRDLMIGVLASLKTLRGQRNDYKDRYPWIDQLSSIFRPSNNTLNLVHYNTEETESLTDQLLWLMDIAGPNCDGIQLNMVWPSVPSLSKFRERYDSVKIVLQVGAKAFKEAGNVGRLADKVYMYRNIVNYVLLDPSGGLGIYLDADELRPYLRELSSRNLPHIGLGVAGGLSPTTLDLVQPLLSEFPDLSWDAEGKLRDENDNLNTRWARDYVRNSYDLVRSNSI